MVNWRLPRVVRFRPSLRVRIGLLLAALAAVHGRRRPASAHGQRAAFLAHALRHLEADPAYHCPGADAGGAVSGRAAGRGGVPPVLGPIRRLALEGLEDADAYGNGVEVLDRRLRHLLDTMRRTQVQLEESHETLRQTSWPLWASWPPGWPIPSAIR